MESTRRAVSLEHAPSGEAPPHPRLVAQLARLGLTTEAPPDSASWARLLGWVSEHYRESERTSRNVVDGMRGWSGFENLFQNSPIPIMEQDYTELESWMDQLRQRGVSSLRDHLGEGVEEIRRLVPRIRIVAANPAAVRAVGVSLEKLIGPIDPGIVNPGSEEGWLSQLEAVWERRPVVHAVFSASTADGRRYDAESILAAPLFNGEPDFSRAVFTLIDVTDHRNEERRMQDLVTAKNQFLAALSHEVRTPLTAILGFAAVLDDGDDLAEDERGVMVHSIVQHAQEVADLVEDLLVVARAESGQVGVSCTAVDLVAEVNKTLRAGGSFTTGISLGHQDDLPRAEVDPVRLRQIIRNLLTNAERYGGPEVAMTIGAEPGRLRLEVADNGPGIDPADMERIFEPYQKAHRLAGAPGSVGIGLAVSRQLAELMGGTLTYRRHRGQSVFTLLLRAADQPTRRGD